MTLCNMVVEPEGKNGVVPTDNTAHMYLERCVSTTHMNFPEQMGDEEGQITSFSIYFCSISITSNAIDPRDFCTWCVVVIVRMLPCVFPVRLEFRCFSFLLLPEHLVMRFVMEGEMLDYLIIGEKFVAAIHKSKEFIGTIVESLTMEESMTLCNMVVEHGEHGSKNGVVPTDSITYMYLEVKGAAEIPPSGAPATPTMHSLVNVMD
ncbi:hypothetical protein ACH5RR_032874 [Cinchona calisaya]|uniref:Aconitase/3-isopropylmalate dehydratase large subunit alpha/beta/alpha domain-containing protein n=1 Tax=Cinchona calisaya TaxID=153742 RepID=A0ABD2YJB8_9GENT